jgi:hypothetical protein
MLTHQGGDDHSAQAEGLEKHRIPVDDKHAAKSDGGPRPQNHGPYSQATDYGQPGQQLPLPGGEKIKDDQQHSDTDEQQFGKDGFNGGPVDSHSIDHDCSLQSVTVSRAKRGSRGQDRTQRLDRSARPAPWTCSRRWATETSR